MPIKTKRNTFYFVVILLLQSVLLSSCSSNSFHLRKNIDLPKTYQKIQLGNLSLESGLGKAFEKAIEEAGGELQDYAETIVNIGRLREGKRVVAYTRERKARIYLVFLKFEYTIQKRNKQTNKLNNATKQRINLDRTFIYDANFALGKAEEEKQIRDGLYAEAARLILLRLHSNELS